MFFRESSRRVDCQVQCGDVVRALYLPFSLSLPLFPSRAPSLSPRVRTAPRPDAFASSSSSSCLLRVPPFPASCSAGVDRVRVAHATRERERERYMRFQTLNFDKHIVRDANLATRHHAIEPLRRCCKSAFPRGSVGHRIRTHFRSPHARTASTVDRRAVALAGHGLTSRAVNEHDQRARCQPIAIERVTYSAARGSSVCRVADYSA